MAKAQTYKEPGSSALTLGARLLRFAVGLVLLAALVLFFGSGYMPPGICGEVLRHNRQLDIDASPFFYNDVENMLELIEAAEQMHRTACYGTKGN